MRHVISLTFLEVLGGRSGRATWLPGRMRPCDGPRSTGLQLRDSAGFAPASPLSLENDPAFRNAVESILSITILADAEDSDNGLLARFVGRAFGGVRSIAIAARQGETLASPP